MTLATIENVLFYVFAANNNPRIISAFRILRVWIQKLVSWNIFNSRASLDWSEEDCSIFLLNGFQVF